MRARVVHDVCSAVHPMGAASPFLRALPLREHGLEWIVPPVCVAHPLDDGSAGVLYRSLQATSACLGTDGPVWERRLGRVTRDWPHLEAALLGPPASTAAFRSPVCLGRFGLAAIRSATGLARGWFRTDRARALFAGCAAHSMLPLEATASAAIGLVLSAVGHRVGWPIPVGGSQSIAAALEGLLCELGGTVTCNRGVRFHDEVAGARVVLYDVAPPGLARILEGHLPRRYLGRLKRYRAVPGVFKIDYVLSHAIPWAAPECARASTVHLGGSLAEIAATERDVWAGKVSERPFTLVSEPTRFDPSRAPTGVHVAWAYCHVPNGCDRDMTAALEAQIERFAPGFRDCVVARHTRTAAQMERYNPNYVGGDIVGGANDLRQILARPVLSRDPYRTPAPGVFLCSASTPPGGGVHGMCGFHAAESALRWLGLSAPPLSRAN